VGTCGNAFNSSKFLVLSHQFPSSSHRQRDPFACRCLRTTNSELRTNLLPARLHDAGNLASQRETAKAQTADAKLPQVSPRPSAELAPIVLAAAELRLPRVFHPFCCGCHKSSNPSSAASDALAERHAEGLQQCPCLVVVLCRGHNRDVHALQLLHLGVVNFRKDQLIS
jgi:hypothetical protein